MPASLRTGRRHVRHQATVGARLLQHAHDLVIRAGFVAGDEVYSGLDLRKSIRERGTGYVLAASPSLNC